jgi:hypothetical protein
MKPVQFTLHPSSALAGAFLLALCLVTLGAFAPQGPSSARDVSATEIVDHPYEDYVRQIGTSAYTVPAGKFLMITGCGYESYQLSTSSGTYVELSIDGVRVMENYYSAPCIETCPYGLVAGPGSTVSTNQSHGIFIGYLVDA